ncbi:hypothetical protein VNI00_016787 [Paramarasmius palmivorus]|uniref:Uncharacterized protein n=1 Tax=Paramarasmius palmivorus TaxID=297713 RepID=A0AAW0BBF1_9AGAR
MKFVAFFAIVALAVASNAAETVAGPAAAPLEERELDAVSFYLFLESSHLTPKPRGLASHPNASATRSQVYSAATSPSTKPAPMGTSFSAAQAERPVTMVFVTAASSVARSAAKR